MKCLINKIYKNDNIKVGIIIQGASNYVNEVKNAWLDFNDNLIFSTWLGEESKYSKNDTVLFNKQPLTPGPFNFNYQKISTYNGLLKAKELGCTHALKIRSDYLPTNAKEFLKLLKLDKLNFLMWNYTSFLWLEYPNLNGYLDDHLSFGPIDEMLELWNIKDNFCHSPEIMLTWSYISKLKDKIELNYILNKLTENNDIYYVKFNNCVPNNILSHSCLNSSFGDRELFGRYESVFKDLDEYISDDNLTKKYLNDDYLSFLKYYIKLPKISIIVKNNDIKNVIYPEKKIEYISNISETTGEYVIDSNKLTNNATLIIEYFKKINSIYTGTTTLTPEKNYNKSELLTIDEYKNNLNKYD